MKLGLEGSGCSNCPTYYGCGTAYRSTTCLSLREEFNRGDPYTYGDQFRDATDKQLAIFLSQTGVCPYMKQKLQETCMYGQEGLCYECWLGHLQTTISEVSENDRIEYFGNQV